MGRLQDRVAIVTGGAAGQGAATARIFVEAGARVLVGDVDDERGRAVAAELGESAIYRRLDVTSEASWQEAAVAATSHFGRIDVLINNAGVVHSGSILDTRLDEFERVMRVNLHGAFLGIKTVAPVMIESGRGSIVNISSIAGIEGLSGLGAYVSSKWALRGLSRTAALELGPRGVRVNTVCPGGVNTQMANPEGKPVREINSQYQHQPIQRIGEPDEVAYASLFLASDEAGFICGAELAVDGGLMAGRYWGRGKSATYWASGLTERQR
jgi:3alpha(or 20beta)-hydroxysteroid dehydrogenase